ncbi:hypothetical protein Droror1_Dr00002010 [Drosera rotundifolia]
MTERIRGDLQPGEAQHRPVFATKPPSALIKQPPEPLIRRGRGRGATPFLHHRENQHQSLPFPSPPPERHHRPSTATAQPPSTTTPPPLPHQFTPIDLNTQNHHHIAALRLPCASSIVPPPCPAVVIEEQRGRRVVPLWMWRR